MAKNVDLSLLTIMFRSGVRLSVTGEKLEVFSAYNIIENAMESACSLGLPAKNRQRVVGLKVDNSVYTILISDVVFTELSPR